MASPSGMAAAWCLFRRDHFADARHLGADPALDAVAERGRRAATAGARATQLEGDDPFVRNVQQLDVATVGLDHRPQPLDDLADQVPHELPPPTRGYARAGVLEALARTG